MSLKLKAVGLCALAAMALSAVVVMNASANGEGHFTNDASNGFVLFTGTEEGAHRLNLTLHGFNGEIGCEVASYAATAASSTVTSLTVTPTYENCYTTGTETKVPVTMNGCTYIFTVAKARPIAPSRQRI